jgi:sugar lactone lactonase YvrE
MRGCASKDRTFGGVGTKCLAFLVLLCGFGVATLSAGAQISLPSAGDIATVAGNGNYGKSGHSGPATSAEFYSDYAVATDASGNLYIVDGGDAVVLKVTASTGNMSTVAGKGTEGYSGDGAAATNAELNWPNGMALDSSGNIYIADSGNCRIRKVTVSTGVITTVAGNGNYGYSGDGAAATSAALNSPQGVAVDSSGNLYIADSGNRVVRKVTASSGIISTVAGTGAAGYTGDGGAATSAELALPESVAVDGSGDIYIADANNNVVRYVKASTGVITTVAGNGTAGYLGDNGAATSAELNSPQGIALDGSGNLYIADTSKQCDPRSHNIYRRHHNSCWQRHIGLLRGRRRGHQCGAQRPSRCRSGQFGQYLHRRHGKSCCPRGRCGLPENNTDPHSVELVEPI